MSTDFRRSGELKSIGSYPVWIQRVVHEAEAGKQRVVEHELFRLMRDARLPLLTMQRFMIGIWPTIEQFPRFMAMNLKKVGYADSLGEDMARRYLIQNIRVEQKHAEHWAAWARSADVSVSDLRSGDLAGESTEELHSLAHWCWYICDQGSLAVAMAATNYAIEGATGEWACLVCSSDRYSLSIPEEIRSSSMRWLKVHAEYDDTHPWEALDIISTLLGHAPGAAEVSKVRKAITRSYRYMELALDSAVAAAHNSFDEAASNASMLGNLYAA